MAKRIGTLVLVISMLFGSLAVASAASSASFPGSGWTGSGTVYLAIRSNGKVFAYASTTARDPVPYNINGIRASVTLRKNGVVQDSRSASDYTADSYDIYYAQTPNTVDVASPGTFKAEGVHKAAHVH